LRRQAGEQLELSDYVRQFPDWEADLRALWMMDQETPVPPRPDLTPPKGDSILRLPDWYLGKVALPVVFGNHRLRREFGNGGMARVFLAEPEPGTDDVALKVPKLPLGIDPKARESREVIRQRFLREIRVTQRFDHPNLCRALEVGELEGLPYFTMPFYTRGSVSEELQRRGRFEENEAARLIVEVARALQVAHDLGILHRDLKPSNLLRHEDGRTIVADFGLAVLFDVKELRLTASDNIPGTPPYLSPEQALGAGELTPASDIFTLGVILYELLTGAKPFHNANVIALLNQIIEASPTPIEERRPEISPALSSICARAMAKEPIDRYASMSAFALDLERFLVGVWTLSPASGNGDSSTVTYTPGTKPLSGRPWRRAVVALAMIGSLGGLVALASRPGNPLNQHGTAPRVVVSHREPIGRFRLLQLLHDDLAATDVKVRPQYRYFSLMEVHDNPYIRDADLALHLDALRRVLNRLSRNVRDVPVYPVDPSGSLLRVDLRDLGWDAAYEWHDLLSVEPYGVRYDASGQVDRPLRKLAHETYDLTVSLDTPSVRGDWFIDAAIRSPLFDLLQKTDGRDRRTPPFELGVADDAIAKVVRLYREGTIDPRVAAAELCLATLAELETRFDSNTVGLRKALGLPISRSRWAEEDGDALFAQFIRSLKLGVPRATQFTRSGTSGMP
jgi:Protein kinase domain